MGATRCVTSSRNWGRPRRASVRRALLAGVVILLAACGQTTGRPPPTPPSPGSPEPGFQALYADASTEGAPIRVYDSSRSAPGRSGPLVFPSSTGAYRHPRFHPTAHDRATAIGPEGIVSARFDGGDRRLELTGSFASYAWARDGTLATVEPANVVSGSTVTIRSPGRQPTAFSLPPDPAASEGETIGLAFSPDGGLLLVQASFAVTARASPDTSPVQVRRKDGSLLFGAPVAGQTVPHAALWGGDGRLYFAEARGVVSLNPTAGTTSVVLRGRTWSRPDLSLDGSKIVFESFSDVWWDRPPASRVPVPNLNVLPLGSGTPGSLAPEWVSHPRFVGATRLWMNGEAVCDRCMTPTRTLPAIAGFDTTAQTVTSTGLSGILDDFDFAVRTNPRTQPVTPG